MLTCDICGCDIDDNEITVSFYLDDGEIFFIECEKCIVDGEHDTRILN